MNKEEELEHEIEMLVCQLMAAEDKENMYEYRIESLEEHLSFLELVISENGFTPRADI